MTQLAFISLPDPRLQNISNRRIMAYGRAWLEALKLDGRVVLRRWAMPPRQSFAIGLRN